MTVKVSSPTSSSGTASMDSSPESHTSNNKSTEKAIKPNMLPLQTKDNICTGILLLKDQKQFFKLNYPTDKSVEEAGGGGHVMSELEVVSECCHYQLGYDEFKDELATFQQSLKQVALQRFASNSTVTDSYKSFDVKFPQVHPNEALLVRARDMVRLVTADDDDDDAAEDNSASSLPMILQEHFWAKVISVTTCGIVTAICVNDLTTINLYKGDYISFPMTCVLGVVHGSYWEYKSKDNNCTTKKKKTMFDANDIKMMEYQTGCSRGKAIEALVQARGDTVRACLGLLTTAEE